jgi:hypothetical protein
VNVKGELGKDLMCICTTLKTSSLVGLDAYFTANGNLLRLELTEVWMLRCVEPYIQLSPALIRDVRH